MIYKNPNYLNNSQNKLMLKGDGFYDSAFKSNYSPHPYASVVGYFDGASWVDTPDHADFTFGTSNYVVEFWFYLDSSTFGSYIAAYGQGRSDGDGGYTSINFQIMNDGTFYGNQCSPQNGSALGTCVNSLPSNYYDKWYFCAMVRDGVNTRLYINGNQIATSSALSTYAITDSAYKFAVGRTGEFVGRNWKGMISDFRLRVGTNGGYTGSYVSPPTTYLGADSYTKLYLPMNSLGTTFTDASTAQTPKVITKNGNATQISSNQVFYGKYFAKFKSSEALTVPNSSDFDFSSGSFTIRFWFNGGSTLVNVIPLSFLTSSVGYYLQFDANKNLTLYTNNNTTTAIASSVACQLNTWYFFQLSSNGTTIKMYLNGNEVGSWNGTLQNSTNSLMIGNYVNNINYAMTYMADVEISKGINRSPTVPTSPIVPDSYTKLHIPMMNPGNNFSDFSGTNKVITKNGSPYITGKSITNVATATISNLDALGHPYFSSALHFNGSTSYLSTPSQTDFQMGSGDFSISAWVNFSSLPAATFILGKWDNVINLREWVWQFTSNTFYFYTSSDGSATSNVSFSWTPTVGTWYFIRTVKVSGVGYVYINGVQMGTSSLSGTLFSGSAPVQIGCAGGGTPSAFFPGYIADVEVAKGIARANVVPSGKIEPDSYTKLLIRGNYDFSDYSGNNRTVTNTKANFIGLHPYAKTCGYFNGTSSTVYAPSGSDYQFGSGDFTFRGWFNFRSASTTCVLFDKWKASSTGRSIQVYYNGAGSMIIYYSLAGSDNTGNASFSWTPTSNTWYFLQVSRVSGILYFYVNGSLIGSSAYNYNLYASDSNMTIGSQDAIGQWFPGLMTDIEVAKGIGRDGTVVPSSYITPDSYTKLLLPMNRYSTIFTDSSSGNQTITNPSSSTRQYLLESQSKAMLFNGTSQYLQIPASSDFSFGTKDFTVELCFNTSSQAGVNRLFDFNTGHVALDLEGTASYFWCGTSTSSVNSWSYTTVANVWNHLALVKYNGSYYLFINGQQIGSAYANSTSVSSTGTIEIGHFPYHGGTSQYFAGKICLFKVHSFAKYTKNFIPSMK